MTILDDVTKKAVNAVERYPVSKMLLGMALVILGIIGALVPIIPGWPFFVIGFELLGIKLLFVDQILFYLKLKEKKV